VSARSYLSIGDVLTLLRQEFPDVTISKIRFLESQGLVNPERTPSGYRKFYEHDVERLRWVLRQQREHFLPLKVIKDRLDEDGAASAPARGSVPVGDVSTDGSAEAVPAVDEVPATPAPATAATATTAPVAVEVPVAVEAAKPSESAPLLVAATADPSPSAHHRAPERAIVGAGASAAAGGGVASAASGRPHRPAPTSRPTDQQVANGRGNGSAGRDGPTTEPAPAAAQPAATAAPAPKPARAARAPKAAPAAPSTPAVPTSPGGTDEGTPVDLASHGGASLSVDDLCAASGLTIEEVVQLQEFGLLSATVAAGVEFFDEEALTVASLAAKFATFGIEARHLRLYKNAAEREAGFIEQIVIPMVRQRNPEARARATHTAEDLARLGQQLRGSLLRSTLRELLAP